MNQVDALAALSALIKNFHKSHELFPPDADWGKWELIYDTRISVEWVPGQYKISLLHGRNDQITLGYYSLSDCLTVLKSATL
jgi:hypothetical protein